MKKQAYEDYLIRLRNKIAIKAILNWEKEVEYKTNIYMYMYRNTHAYTLTHTHTYTYIYFLCVCVNRLERNSIYIRYNCAGFGMVIFFMFLSVLLFKSSDFKITF